MLVKSYLFEVKADKNVTAKSLAYYRKQYLPKLSVRLSALKHEEGP